jgi:hypothetical protein
MDINRLMIMYIFPWQTMQKMYRIVCLSRSNVCSLQSEHPCKQNVTFLAPASFVCATQTETLLQRQNKTSYVVIKP